jgi:hypothetical protein
VIFHESADQSSARTPLENKHPPNVRNPFHSGFRTENPCVAGSIPALSTPQPSRMKKPGGVAGTFRDTLPGCFLK